MAPCWLRRLVRLFGICHQEMLDRARYLLRLSGGIEEIHLIIPFANFVRQAARPGLDLVEPELLFVIPRLAYVDSFVAR